MKKPLLPYELILMLLMISGCRAGTEDIVASDSVAELLPVEKYYQFLEALSGKFLLTFEHSAHTPFIAETERFNREVIRIKHWAGTNL